MKKIIYIILSCFLITSCGEQEVTEYDVFNDRTLIQFESNISNLEVTIDSEGTVEIPISVSTYSNMARTINVEVVPITDIILDEANTDQYSFDGNVIIPPNELRGTLVVTGIDAGIEDNQDLILQLKIGGTNFDNFSVVDQIHVVTIKQICPIPNDFFVGTYILSSPIANIWCSDPRPFFIGNGVEVEVSIGDSSNKRVFSARYSPGSCDAFSGIEDFVIGLSCGQTFLDKTVDTGVFCDSSIEIVIANDANRAGTYDINDDSTIIVNVIDDVNGSCTACCGAPFTNQSFTLTKV